MWHLKWKPTNERIVESQLYNFIQAVNQKFNLNLNNSDNLHEWSINHIAQFWSYFWEFSGIKASKLWDNIVINDTDMLNTQWFTGSKLNYAENLLKKKNSDVAIIFRNENSTETKYTFKELHHKVANYINHLKQVGVKKGDVVVCYMPNLPETVMAMLATTSIGAIWSSCSPDFGVNGALDRLGQINPKVLFTVDGYFYNGKTINCHDKIVEIVKNIPNLKQIIITKYAKLDNNINELPKAIYIEDIVNIKTDTNIVFEQVEFDHPLFIMYSSGTTGKPKCIVHSTGGTLIQHLKEHMLHTNIKNLTKVFYYTTCGWMMWNWLVSSLASGATLMLYDGAPIPEQNKGILFDFVDNYNINIFGTSAKYLSALEKTGYTPIDQNKLTNLTTILSTGSPLLPENYDYVYTKIKKDILLCSISGGTDIISCFALGDPTKPVYSGELQQLGFGLDVKILNDNGKVAKIGEKGELSCVKPFPSQPIYFLNDKNKEKYKQAYFNKIYGIWCHGDYAASTKHHGLIIYGRSDTTLNPGGVRIGTAEIYRQVETIDSINEAVVVGRDTGGDIEVILFVKMQPNKKLTEDIVADIKHKIRFGASPHHVPAKIIAVTDIPKTVSGKIVELAVKNAICGIEIKNIGALANPESLEFYKKLSI